MVKIWLKEFYEALMEAKKFSTLSEKDVLHKKAKNAVCNYHSVLIKNGWRDDISEGCISSPNKAVSFYTYKQPYVGRLVPFGFVKELTDYEFIELAKANVNIDDFVIVRTN